jgi:peptidoglycan/xylan/chitin deacetylase (PgdA/CDA1 family)
VSAPQGLETLYRQSDIVVGGGRIALEAASLGCEVVAFGEKQSLGWLNAGLWGNAVRTNFGDMGEGDNFSPQFLGAEIEKAVRSALGFEGSTQGQGTRGLNPEHFTDYQLRRVGNELEQIYRSARMGYNFSSLPILMYHKVLDKPENSPHRIFVTTSRFESHLRFFKMMGFSTLTFSELADFWFERKPLAQMPRSPVLLTFDDGYRNNLINAGPLLVRYGMKASLFLLADSGINRNSWDPPSASDEDSMMLLDARERRLIEEFGFRIESHGLDHSRLTELPDGEVLFQLEESRRLLSQESGHEIVCCAYPYGDVDSRLPLLAAEVGYSFAVNTDRGGLRWFDEPHSLFRVNVFPEDGWFDLWRKTLPWYRRRYFHKRGQ